MSAEPRPGLPDLAAAQHAQTVPLPAPAGLPCWHFENAEFDEALGALRVDGLPVAVEPRPLRLLAELLHHHGQVLSKEQLLASVWQGRPTVEHVLPSAVNRLRKALGPRASSRIVTLPRQGYRFMGTVQRSPAAAALPQRSVPAAAVPEPVPVLQRHPLHAPPHESQRPSMPMPSLEPWPAPAAAGPQVPPTAAQAAEAAPMAPASLPGAPRVAPMPPVAAAPAAPPAPWLADSPAPARRAAWLVAAASAVALLALLLAVALATLASRAA